jgi:hypothetical protein
MKGTTMSTHVTISHPVRSDVTGSGLPDVNGTAAGNPTGSRSRGWALAGLGAGLAGVATVILTSSISTVYDSKFEGDITGVGAGLADHYPAMFAFHTVAVVGALLSIVFAVGLQRRLRQRLQDSVLPMLAFAGLTGTAVVSILGSGMDTEVMMGAAQGMRLDDPTAAAYNHWIGTIPWVHVLTGLTALAVYAAARKAAVPRWIGIVGLVFGGLAVAVGASPLEYLAIVPASLWLIVTSLGFALGDKAHRAA